MDSRLALQGSMCIARGSCHQGSSVFGSEVAGRQCTTIGFAAVLYSAVISMSRWKPEDVDNVMHAGTELFRKIRPTPFPLYVDTQELPPKYGLKCGRTKTIFYQIQRAHVSGHFSTRITDREYSNFSLEDAFLQLSENDKYFGGLLTMNAVTVAVTYERITKLYYLCDSHSLNSVGTTCPNGRSIVLEFSVVKLLAQHIRRNYTSGDVDQQFDFVRLTCQAKHSCLANEDGQTGEDVEARHNYFGVVDDVTLTPRHERQDISRTFVNSSNLSDIEYLSGNGDILSGMDEASILDPCDPVDNTHTTNCGNTDSTLHDNPVDYTSSDNDSTDASFLLSRNVSEVEVDASNLSEMKISNRPLAKSHINAMDLNQIAQDLQENCNCGKDCNSQLDKMTVWRWRKKIHVLANGFRKNTAILNLYRESIETRGFKAATHKVEDLKICNKSWCATLLKISRSTYQRCKRNFEGGLEQLESPRCRISNREKGHAVLGFLDYEVSLLGDIDPETGRRYMPQGVNLTDLFNKYLERSDHSEHVHVTYFRKIFNTFLKPSVSLQRSGARMSRCSVCSHSRLALEHHILPEDRATIVRERDEHFTRARQERRSYYERRAEAISRREYVTSVIEDGMDQSKTDLPHYKGWRTPKDFDSTSKLQSHITGIILHGITTEAFVDVLQWPHDSNLAINCLLNSLQKHFDSKPLTEKLYIQLDNCGRENKNKYYLATIAYLVAHDFFKEVQLNFLMVGHTHEDIDGRFGNISHTLEKRHALTVEELIHTINSTLLKEKMRGYLLNKVYNVKDWIFPFLQELTYISEPHCFKIFKDRHNHVAVQYKFWSSDIDWKPFAQDPPIELFKLDIVGNQQLPTGQPLLVEPTFVSGEELSNLRVNIQKVQNSFTPHQKKWWQDFLDRPERLLEDQSLPLYPGDRPCFFDALRKYETPVVQYTDIQPTVISTLMQKERFKRQMYTGRKRKEMATAIAVSTTEASRVSEQASSDTCIRANYECPNAATLKSNAMIAYMDQEDEWTIGLIVGVSVYRLDIQIYRSMGNDVWIGTHYHENIDIPQNHRYQTFSLTPSGRLPGVIKDLLKS